MKRITKTRKSIREVEEDKVEDKITQNGDKRPLKADEEQAVKFQGGTMS